MTQITEEAFKELEAAGLTVADYEDGVEEAVRIVEELNLDDRLRSSMDGGSEAGVWGVNATPLDQHHRRTTWSSVTGRDRARSSQRAAAPQSGSQRT